MNKNYEFFLAASMFFATEFSFGAQMDNKVKQARYNVIVNAFSLGERAFDLQFLPARDHVALLVEHQKNLEDQLLKKQAIFDQSYMPLLLRIGSGIIVLNGLEFFRMACVFLGASRGVARPEFSYTSEGLSTLGLPRSLIITPIVAREDAPTVFVMTSFCLFIMSGLMGGASYCLFKTAASYKNELEELKYGIDLDTAMLAALEALIQPQ